MFKMIDINTKISAGSKKLREWMLFPLNNGEALQNRQRHIEWLVGNQQSGIFEQIDSYLANMRDLRHLSLRISTFCGKYSDWFSLYESLSAIESLCNINYQNAPSIFEKLNFLWNDDMKNLKQMLSDQIDFDLTKSRKKLSFKFGIKSKFGSMAECHGRFTDNDSTIYSAE